MTVLHQADIKSRVARFLDRRTMPKRLEGKPAAQSDEITALCRSVERGAPRDPERLSEWWGYFETRLGEAGTGLWPIEKEIREAARQASEDMGRANPIAFDALDPVVITAGRMSRGEPVAEGWLYGRNAVDLIARGMVTREVMETYRGGAFLARRAMAGQEAALRWEADAKAAHEAAKELHRLRDQPRQRFDTQSVLARQDVVDSDDMGYN